MARHVDPDTGEIVDISPDPPHTRPADWIIHQLGKAFPHQLIKRKGQYQYVPGRAVQARLDAITNGAWSWRLHGPGEFVETHQRRRQPDGTYEAVPIRAYVTTGTLSIPGMGSKDGRGVQDLGDEAAGLSTSAIMLGADTRALRNAAERMGLWKPGDDTE